MALKNIELSSSVGPHFLSFDVEIINHEHQWVVWTFFYINRFSINSFIFNCALIPKKVGLKRENMGSTKIQKVVLRDVDIFKDCSEHFLQDVFALSEEVSYLSGEIIKEVGRVNTHIWVVVSGSVNIVNGNDTVLHNNGVVGIYSQMNNLGFFVYTAYAAREGAICIRISKQVLNTMFKKYPQDKQITIRNTLKYVDRRPRAHILAAMQMQVNNAGRHFTEGPMTILNPNKSSHCKKATHSKSLRNVFEVTESTKPHSKLGIEIVPECSLSAPNLNYGKNDTKDSMNKIRSNGLACRQDRIFAKSSRNVFKFKESMDGRSILEIQRDGQDCRTEMDVRLNAVLMTEHSDSITQINSEKIKSLAPENFQRPRRHSAPVTSAATFSSMISQLHKACRNSVKTDGGAPFYSNVNSRENHKSATEYVRIGKISHMKLGQNFRCMCLSFLVMIALLVTWFNSASPIHSTEA